MSAPILMPDLVRPAMNWRHTSASAIETLTGIGIPESKICFRLDGFGGPAGIVTGQSPGPGTPVDDTPRIVVMIGGFGLFHDLPFGMRIDSHDEDLLSTSGLMALFDSELIRFRYQRDEAPLLFGIGPDRHEANARWLRLFDFDPDLWPRERHFTLCTLIPDLHRIGGTEAGVRLVLSKLLDVNVAEIRYRRNFCEVSGEDRIWLHRDSENGVLDARNLRLGYEAILGARIEGARGCDLRLGPVSLEQWRDLTSETGARRIEQALWLSMPIGISYSYSFIVGEPARVSCLGVPARNSVLGRNSHLGSQPWPEIGDWSTA